MAGQKEKKRLVVARWGIATAGIVYCLLGILTIATVFTGKSQNSSKDGVLTFISEQPFGVFLLGLTGVGLLAYSFWRFYQTVVGKKNNNLWKNTIKRIGSAGSGLLYAFLGVQAISKSLGLNLFSGGGKQSFIDKLGVTGLTIATVIFLGIAIAQFYRAYSKKYRKKIKEGDMDKYAKNIMLKAGIIGYTARGVVIAIISYFLYLAATTANNNNVGGTDKAFNFIQESFGQTLLMIVAFGFFAYGAFMLITAKYRDMSDF